MTYASLLSPCSESKTGARSSDAGTTLSPLVNPPVHILHTWQDWLSIKPIDLPYSPEFPKPVPSLNEAIRRRIISKQRILPIGDYGIRPYEKKKGNEILPFNLESLS